ncbi:MAG: hypothetical protein ACD_30C00112G0061 [uncultured bacterium]|uniref:ATP synthase subunit delta n=4 Tax=Candidatus Daviesiibacteriota TaxID=1752718 RepID=A0A0G0EUC3_9BACT|nr:MAG: hypothetical protein ACD_30C00112G0061 [uncultured bacterium]KKQ10518.1 MAG: ATP synthase subunit delta [Candidatus Daviesbacteria bacterium GW2011_GWB1_36_5]KKQ14942.1 MAG: ATP synthase subunit delta [Candidatus Daviesbacteria bacterium GW2011_GWA1_36_8]OGE17221.1 MAG: hypothetical protein A2858_00760 [Candidatus Daviesbacteria bacterium RIFCSPHIGHO2_01_FULL_36_37]OGE36001.1 MAG: hypothetical protein A3E66_01755 [Candidatus Daviesbacteria bacterium RIFCSPHIGHO2_12_FULL_37_16]
MNKSKKLVKLINNLVEASFTKGKLDDFFVKKTISNLKKLKSNEAIFALEKYKKGLGRKLNETTLSIESSAKLSPDEINKIKKDLYTKYSILNTTFLLNPSILGGLRLRIGDYLLDYSLKNSIKQIGDIVRGI